MKQHIVTASDLGLKVSTSRCVFGKASRSLKSATIEFQDGLKFVGALSVRLDVIGRTHKGVRRMMRRYIAQGRLPVPVRVIAN